MTTSESYKEIEWLDALAHGDAKAFTLIYNEYWKFLFRIAYTTTQSKEAAQELVQEVFVSLWVNRSSAKIRTNLKSYLSGAIRNKVFDYYDKQKVRDRYRNNVMLEKALITHNTTEESIEYEEISSLVNEHIDRLPETTRKIFMLSRFNGFSIPEIAKELSVSVKTVEYHLTKALKHLRLHLTEYIPKSAGILIFIILLLS